MVSTYEVLEYLYVNGKASARKMSEFFKHYFPTTKRIRLRKQINEILFILRKRNLVDRYGKHGNDRRSGYVYYLTERAKKRLDECGSAYNFGLAKFYAELARTRGHRSYLGPNKFFAGIREVGFIDSF